MSKRKSDIDLQNIKQQVVAQKQTQQQIECTICVQPYHESDSIPYILPCGHTLCFACIKKIYNDNDDHIKCP